MGDTKTTLTWLLRDQVSGPAKAVDDKLKGLGKTAGGSGGLIGKLGAMTGGLVNPMSLAFAGGTALVGALVGAADAAAKEQVNIAKMGTALKAAVPGFDGNTTAIEALISKREDLAFSDDELRDSLATLVTSTHDVSEAQDLQSTAMDLARLKHIDLATASEALAKANVGSTKELKALGIAVDDSKDKTQVFAAIQKAAAGQAAAFAKTSEGKWQTLQNKLGDVVEDVGGKLLPIFDAVVSFIIDPLVPALSTIGGVIGDIIGFIADLVKAAMPAFRAIAGFIGGVIDKVASLIGWVKDAIGFLGDLLGAKHAADAPLNPDGHRALGGPVIAGGTYTVGENGPETLVMGGTGGYVIPNSGGSGGGAPVSLSINLDGRTIAKVVDEHLYYSLRRSAPSLLRS